MKFSNIRLLVNDFDACYAFYHDTLGLECSWGSPGDNYASFNIGIPSGLALFTAEYMPHAIRHGGNAPKEQPHDHAVIILQVEDVDKSCQSLQRKGVKFLSEPADMAAWGIRVVHFRDPENHLIELYSELPKEK